MAKQIPGLVGDAPQKEAPKTIRFHNTPAFYLEYTKNWLVHQRQIKANPAELAIVEDIHQLVAIAVGVLEPAPAEPGKDK